MLIAAAFCMYKRYFRGLATAQPTGPGHYQEAGRRIIAHSYAAGRLRKKPPALSATSHTANQAHCRAVIATVAGDFTEPFATGSAT
ncbi:hypothetical protein ACWDNY_28845, partial [Streptomyces sp. NPDC003697]